MVYDSLHEKYQQLKKKAQPYLDALEIASERVRDFLDAVIVNSDKTLERAQPKRNQKQDMEL